MVDSMHKRGARMLSEKLRQTERRLVTVTRGATSIELYAGVTHGAIEQVTEFVGNLRTEVWKFVVKKIELFGSAIGEPEPGDIWSYEEAGQTLTYFAAKMGNEPCWKPLDEYGNDVLVYTKKITVAGDLIDEYEVIG